MSTIISSSFFDQLYSQSAFSPPSNPNPEISPYFYLDPVNAESDFIFWSRFWYGIAIIEAIAVPLIFGLQLFLLNLPPVATLIISALFVSHIEKFYDFFKQLMDRSVEYGRLAAHEKKIAAVISTVTEADLKGFLQSTECKTEDYELYKRLFGRYQYAKNRIEHFHQKIVSKKSESTESATDNQALAVQKAKKDLKNNVKVVRFLAQAIYLFGLLKNPKEKREMSSLILPLRAPDEILLTKPYYYSMMLLSGKLTNSLTNEIVTCTKENPRVVNNNSGTISSLLGVIPALGKSLFLI